MVGKNASGKRKIGSIEDHIAIIGSLVAKSFVETNGAKIITRAEISKVKTKRITNDAFTYSSALSVSPLARCPEIKFTAPAETPRSLNDDNIITKFRAAENIPKSAIESDLATNNVKRNPQNEDRVLPINRISVSFAVDVVANPKI